jgi:succinate dehydrogenase hydrophobic anchor subunit
MRESKLWFWHIVSALVILVLLSLHMGIMHLSTILNFLGIGSGDPLNSTEVFRRSQHLFFAATYIVLLGAALYHGLYGFRTILLELSPSKTLQKLIGRACAVVGFALFVYGSYVAILVYQMKGV